MTGATHAQQAELNGIRSIIPIAAPLLLGYGALQAGNTLQGSLLAVRGEAIGFSATDIGVVAAGFWIGMILGSLYVPNIIRSVGQVRTFAALASLASAAALLHLLIQDPISWVFIRMVTGVCFAGLFIAVESWLNGAATTGTRGRLFAIYGMTGLLAGVCGQFMLPLADASSYVLFCVVSVIISLSLVPVALTKVQAPGDPASLGRGKLAFLTLYQRTPFGVIGAILIGICSGAFFGLGPYFAVTAGMRVSEVAIFMAIGTIGAFVMTWPLGRLSDRTDRRTIIVGQALVALALLGTLALFVQDPAEVRRLVHYAFAFGFGALIVPAYSILIAHVNDRVNADEYVHASGRLLILYGIGSASGPVLAGFAISAIGSMGFSLVIIAAQALLAALGIWRIAAESAPSDGHKGGAIPNAITPAISLTYAAKRAMKEKFAMRKRGSVQQ